VRARAPLDDGLAADVLPSWVVGAALLYLQFRRRDSDAIEEDS
jgi:uncharacterized protein (TIGR03382 family)